MTFVFFLALLTEITSDYTKSFSGKPFSLAKCPYCHSVNTVIAFK